MDTICRRYSQMPSERLRLEEHGFSDVTAYQFDKAVATLANRIDQKSRETVPVKVKALDDPGKGMAWGQQPKWTMRQLLTDGAGDESEDEGPLPDAILSLPTAGL